MDIEKAEQYIRTMLKDKDIPDGVKTISYVYAKEAIETVLSELEKKDKEIKQLKSMELKAKHGIASITLEGLINLENGIKKKDKIINEMATTLSLVCTGIEVIRKQFEENYCEFMNSDEDCCWKADKECSDCIKEYFTNKVEREGK